MAILNNATMEALNQGIVDSFNETLAKTKTDFDAVITTVPVNTQITKFPFLGVTTGLKKWIDNKQVGNVKLESKQLEVFNWEDTIEISANAIKFDQLGLYSALPQRLARAGVMHKQSRVVEALQAGTADVGFDGLATFSAVHTLNPAAVQSNNLTSTALSATNFDAAYAAMSSYVGVDGKPLNIKPTHLVVPPQLRATALSILKAQYLASGASNTNYEIVDLIVSGELSNEATTWYLVSNEGVAPFIFGEFEAPHIVSLTSDDAEPRFNRNVYTWSAEAIGGAILGPWMSMIRAIA